MFYVSSLEWNARERSAAQKLASLASRFGEMSGRSREEAKSKAGGGEVSSRNSNRLKDVSMHQQPLSSLAFFDMVIPHHAVGLYCKQGWGTCVWKRVTRRVAGGNRRWWRVAGLASE